MKKISSLMLAAAVGLLALSCAKTETPVGSETIPSRPEQDTPQTEPETQPEIPEGFVRIRLQASTEQVEGSKTTLSDGEGSQRIVSWVQGDKIKLLYDGGSDETQAQEAGTTTSLQFDIPEEVSEYYLAYPSTAEYALEGSALSITIPAEQDGLFEKANFSLAAGTKDGGSIQFYNASSLFKLVVTDATLTKAVISGNNGEALAGTLPFTFTEEGIVPGTPGSTSETLTLLISGAGTYYISALPGLDLPDGATVRFFRGDAPAGGFQLTSALQVARARIASWGELDKVACNRYVTLAGAGSKSGHSWANAWGRDEFKAFLVNSAGYTKEQLTLMDGITVRVAAGTYVLPDSGSDQPKIDFSEVTDEVLHFRFAGGYPAEGGDAAEPSSHPTVLSGGGLSGVLWALNPIHLAFDGFTISGSRTKSGGRGAITFAAPGSLTISNCIFTDNINTATCGALDITDGCQFTITSCTFSGNQAAYAGAFNVDTGEDVMTTGVISDCVFSGNSTTAVSGNGGAFKVSHGSLTVNDCSFSGNTTLCTGETGSHGGAVWADGGQATFNRCSFQGNSSRWGGAVYSRNEGNAVFNDCIFGGSAADEGNSSSASGGAVAIDNGDLTFTGCTFRGNSSADRGGVFFVSTNTGSLTIDGGIYAANKAVNGAVVYAQNKASVNVSSAEFNDNNATGAGGVMVLSGNAVAHLTGNNFHDNYGGAGGVVSIWGTGSKSINTPVLNVGTGNVFRANSCQSGGGAIRIRQEPNVATTDSETGNETKAEVHISGDNRFIDNFATGGYGGCLDLRTSGKVTISGATFTGNQTKVDQNYGKAGAVNLTDAGLGTGDFTISDCRFTGNHTFGGTSSANTGGAVNVGGNGTDWAMMVKIDKCIFDGNMAKQGGAISFQDASCVSYLNNCVFTGNYITYRYGTTILITAGTVCMNNCSFADNTYSTESNTTASQQCTWINVKPKKLVMSNCTLIGTTRRSGGVETPSGSACLLRFDKVANTHYLINNIIAPTVSGCNAMWADNSPVIYATSNKTGTKSWSGSSVTYNAAGVESDGFTGNSTYFGGLAWHSGASVADYYWAWNGTLSGGSNNNLASLADVKAAIQTADAGFYTWLEGLGALDKDIRGNARGASTWPGAYQN